MFEKRILSKFVVETKQKQKESMKDVENNLIEIFCHTDDFNKVFINELRTHKLIDGSSKRIKPGSLNESEVMTIVIYFHCPGCCQIIYSEDPVRFFRSFQ